jgi:hypothetical protein
MLEVISVALGYLTVHSLFDPSNGVYDFVPPLFHQFDCEGILGVDGPDDENTVLLKFGNRDLFDELVAEGVVLNGNSSGRLRSGEFPGRVHHYDVEVALSEFELFLDELVKVKSCHICTDGDRVFSDIRLLD